MKKSPSILVTRAEAARLLSISLAQLDRLIRVKQLPHVCVGGRILLRRADLEAFPGETFHFDFTPDVQRQIDEGLREMRAREAIEAADETDFAGKKTN